MELRIGWGTNSWNTGYGFHKMEDSFRHRYSDRLEVHRSLS